MLLALRLRLSKMKLIRLSKYIALVVSGLLICSNVYARPLELAWDAVTKTVDGSPAANVRYRVYKKTTLDDFTFIWETKNSRWTWLVPSIGHYEFMVLAVNDDGEGEPSDPIKVFVERIPRKE